MLPDIAQTIATASANPWLLLPAALVLGALHGLEPGHAKSMMAAFIVSVRGTRLQAALLGLSAAISHSAVVAALAFVGLWLGDAAVGDKAQPWLHLVGGAIVIAMALWMFRRILYSSGHQSHHHHHDHDHHDDHGHAHCGHSHAPKQAMTDATTAQIMLFGLTGGLMPCPASIAVLMICLQLKKVVLGATMVAAFSTGLALTLVTVGVLAAWGRGHVERLYGEDRAQKLAKYLPMASTTLMLALGLLMAATGLVHLL